MESLVASAIGERTPNERVQNSSSAIKIVTMGLGGAGNNTINRLIRAGVKGTELVAVNTDAQHLTVVDDKATKLLIGKSVTKGLGAGGFLEVGAKAAEVDRAALESVLSGAHLVFICLGFGGGTGTGAVKTVAEIAKKQGAITVVFGTYPFHLERARKAKADQGIESVRKVADTVIILDNNKLVELVPNLPMNQAFSVADEILARAIGGLVWTITQPSLINIDFADVRAIMDGQGVGFIAVGEGKGNNKVADASEGVLKNRLLDVDFYGATGALIHISGGADLTLGDAIKSGEMITERMAPTANVKWGARLIPGYDGKLEIVAIVTGVQSPQIMGKYGSESSGELAPVYADIATI